VSALRAGRANPPDEPLSRNGSSGRLALPFLFASLIAFSSVVLTAHAATAAPLQPDITVATDGSGNFTSVQAAVDSIPKDNTERRIIFIKNGTYTEHIRMERSFVTLTGEDRDKTRLVWEINDPRKDPAAHKDGKGIASFNLRNASDVVIENLTIENPANLGLKPFAVFASGEGTRIVVQDANILGLGGDTFSLWTGGMYYHRNLYVTGTYHFFGPRGTCYLRDSVLEIVGSVRNALFNEGMQDERQKFVLHRTKIVSKVPFGLGSNFRDAAWYFIDCEFPDTLRPEGQIFIQQSNDARPQPVSAMFKWAPDRVYFSGSKGPDYPWLKDNLEKSEAKSSAEITAAWTFSGQWDPERTTPPAITSFVRTGNNVNITFAEPVTVKGRPMLGLTDGQSATYQSGSGTTTLTFNSASAAQPATVRLNGGAIVASRASAKPRLVPDGLKL
jgi:pectinesterase